MHPLAATASQDFFSGGDKPLRAIFYDSNGDELSTTGEALRVDDVSWLDLPADSLSPVIHDDDRFAGYLEVGDVPSLFGLQREVMGVIGLNAVWIDRVRQLPAPVGRYAEKDDNGVPIKKLKNQIPIIQN